MKREEKDPSERIEEGKWPNDCVIELKLRLRKEAQRDGRHEQIKDKSISLVYPSTCNELKKVIEEKLQIPGCQQKLYFASRLIPDKQSLLPFHLRTGDQVDVEYIAQAKMKEISKVVELIQNAVNFLETNITRINNDWSPVLHNRVRSVMRPLEVENLMRRYFLPHLSEISDSNRLYFIHKNGLKLTVRFHEILSSCKWESMPFEMQCMERASMVVLWNLSATLGIRYLLLNETNFIDNVCKSVVRQDILTGQRVRAPVNQRAVVNHSFMHTSLDNLLIEVMFKGMGIITNISEIPLCQIQIASKPNVLRQMASALLSPSFNIFSAHVIISAFLNLSYNPKTHCYLTTPLILEGVIGAHKKQLFGSQDRTDIIILKYYTTLFFSLICTTSTDFANSESFETYSKNITLFFKDFFQSCTPSEVKNAETAADYFWSTLKPFVDLVYVNFDRNNDLTECHHHQQQQPLLKELHTLSVRAGIFLLNNACKSLDSINVLENERQIDYIVCLPWYIDESLREEARAVVRSLSLNKKLSPPRLCNIAKAKLATFSDTHL